MKSSTAQEERAENAKIVGDDLAQLIPQTGMPFWRVWHLLRLNLILLIPMFSAGTIGYDGAMINALQIAPYWKKYFHHPVKAQLGLINAIFPVGKICGLAMVTPITIQAASVNVGMLVFSRWFLGVGTAFMAQPSPIIITELACPTHRGKVTALFNTFYFFGAILAAWLTYGTIKRPDDWSWRIPSLLQGAFPFVQLLFWFAVPESPRWLIAKGKVQEARVLFTRQHAGGDVNSPLVQFEMEEIQETFKLEKELPEGGSWRGMAKTPANRRRCMIAVILGAFAQWVGNAVITYYLTLVLNDIGITDATHQALINGGLQIFNLFAVVFCGALMVDSLGRRTLFLWSAAGMCISYITALNSRFIETKSVSVGIAVVPMLFVFFFHYDIAFTPLLYAYPAEIFPYALRGAGVSLTSSSSHGGLIVSQFVNPIAMANISWKYYIGHTLEEIALAFEGDQATVKNAIPEIFGKGELEVGMVHVEDTRAQ
ncbi:related to hexose transporter protein [Phialocephala subalpina]|uniref:Related to hexose transporter protein n=1 Tax=Phialocephala subalpina TaxID=576137 RepID=A0A1L7WSS1_9HELO|nr:related to hexose transporter protein [Phialocephala subalpina]